MNDALVLGLSAAGVAAWTFGTNGGRDFTAVSFARAAARVDLIVGADHRDHAAVRRLHAYRVVPWGGGAPVTVLAPNQIEAASAVLTGDGTAGTVECLLLPHRIARVKQSGERVWMLIVLPEWLRRLGAGPCEHGGADGHAATAAAQRTNMDERVRRFAAEGKLEECVAAAEQDPAARPKLHYQLLCSDIYSVVLENSAPGPAAEAMTSHPLVKGPDGSELLPVYTTAARFSPVEGMRLLKMSFAQFVLLAWSRRQVAIVLNPNGPLPSLLTLPEMEHLARKIAEVMAAQGPPDSRIPQ